MIQSSAAEDQLREQTRAALQDAGISQAAAARELGITAKHMCQMLTGRQTLALGWAERILALRGRRIAVTTPRRRARQAGSR